MKPATDDTFAEQVVSSERPVIVDFWASWCVKCTAMKPTFEALTESDAPGWDIVSVDVEANPQIAADYTVMSLPTVLIFRQGEVTQRSTGRLSKAEILSLME